MRRALLIGLWLTAALALSGWTHGSSIVSTVDPNANSQTRNTLIYLQNVGHRTSHRVVTGQFFGTLAYNAAAYPTDTSWQTNIVALQTLTGVTPGMIGADYNDYNPPSPSVSVSFTTLNSYIEAAASGGSLITIAYHAKNPWTNGGYNDTSCGGGSLADLANPAMPVYTAWHAELANVAAGLQALQSAGVTVIWRPLLEQNSSTAFWWVACNPTYSQSAYAAVWADMFAYFTTNYGLHNLLWSYSSNLPQSTIGVDGLSMYPGGSYVDIVGYDDYQDVVTPPFVAVPEWQNWMALGKVFGYTERGPDETNDTSPLYSNLMPGIVANAPSSVPMAAFFAAWISPYNIAANPGATTLIGDINSANQGDVATAISCMASATNYAARVACALR